MPRNEKKAVKSKEGARLKRLREKLGFTQRELAQEFKVSNGSIDHWENCNRTIPGSVLKLIEIYEEKIKNR